MAHFIGISNKRPNALQKRTLANGLKAIDADLSLCVGVKGNYEQAFYVEAPDNYGASHMQDKCAAVQALVKRVLGA